MAHNSSSVQRPGALTARERKILSLVASGLRNREIAAELSIAEATVENHLHHIFVKLGVGNRVQAALRAVQLNPLVAQDDEK
jgi:DNA-binding NarL/FixJ family response regulator